MSKQFKVSDLFAEPGKRPKVDNRDCQEYLKNQSIWNQFGISAGTTTTHYRNEANDLSKLLIDDNDEMTNIRLVDPNNKNYMESFDKTINNRLQRFNFKSKLIDYKDVTRVEKISGEGYGVLKDNLHCNNFYNLYKKNEFNPNKEDVFCVLCFKK